MRKLEPCGIDDMLIHIDTVHKSDGQSDRMWLSTKVLNDGSIVLCICIAYSSAVSNYNVGSGELLVIFCVAYSTYAAYI